MARRLHVALSAHLTCGQRGGFDFHSKSTVNSAAIWTEVTKTGTTTVVRAPPLSTPTLGVRCRRAPPLQERHERPWAGMRGLGAFARGGLPLLLARFVARSLLSEPSAPGIPPPLVRASLPESARRVRDLAGEAPSNPSVRNRDRRYLPVFEKRQGDVATGDDDVGSFGLHASDGPTRREREPRVRRPPRGLARSS